MWKEKFESGQVNLLTEEFVTENFGISFRDKCKRLGKKKFVPIPVGSCKSPVMSKVPHLIWADAPKIKYWQGDIDSCVFSSLAFTCLGIALHRSSRLATGCEHLTTKVKKVFRKR